MNFSGRTSRGDRNRKLNPKTTEELFRYADGYRDMYWSITFLDVSQTLIIKKGHVKLETFCRFEVAKTEPKYIERYVHDTCH